MSPSVGGHHPTTLKFQQFFWPLVLGLVKPAIKNPSNANELLELCFAMFRALRASRSPVLDVPKLLPEWIDLLFSYRTFEVMFSHIVAIAAC